ncbi:hypothetical protein AW736_26395 [Termitidicoccus mucosus]|uniref:Nucleotidyltransferase n=1 Tax=Termitidicoccus mucosus TaxID=1184151 RepID=A0A178IPW6_9BACT|nr:hypothetical protein AW736_26395 [Opitutaceae bacterium TSB47]
MPDFEPKAFADLFGDQSKPLIVGGQAVNLWAEVMRDQSPELLRLAPFTSTDADIVGDVALAQKLAERRGWQIRVNPDARNPIAAVLSKESPGGLLEVDVLRSVLGVNHADLSGGVTIEMLPGVNARVPSPLTLLKAKIGNLCALDNKRFDGTTRNDLRHASMLVTICRLYLHGMAREVRAGVCPERALVNELHTLNDIITSRNALQAGKRFQLDLSPALPLDLDCAQLPKVQKFYEFHKQGPRQNPGIKI